MRILKLLGLLTMLVTVGNAQVSVQCPAFPCTITVTAPAPPQTGKFSVGDRVVTAGVVNVRASGALSATLVGSQPNGALGTIKGGGTTNAADGFTWWQVDYDSGADGWSGEGPLSKASPIVVVHGVSLSWTAPAGTITGYNVYRGTTPGGPYGLNTSTLVTGTTYLDPSAVAGTTYYYVVKAVNAKGEGPASNEVKITR